MVEGGFEDAVEVEVVGGCDDELDELVVDEDDVGGGDEEEEMVTGVEVGDCDVGAGEEDTVRDDDGEGVGEGVADGCDDGAAEDAVGRGVRDETMKDDVLVLLLMAMAKETAVLRQALLRQ